MACSKATREKINKKLRANCLILAALKRIGVPYKAMDMAQAMAKVAAYYKITDTAPRDKVEFAEYIAYLPDAVDTDTVKKIRNRHPVGVGALAPPKRSACPTLKAAGAGKISEFYKSWDWKKLSYETRKARGQRCECCGGTPEKHGVRIVCDHIKPIRKHWDLRLEPSNLQVLCDDCNRGKASHDETDWRRTA